MNYSDNYSVQIYRDNTCCQNSLYLPLPRSSPQVPFLVLEFLSNCICCMPGFLTPAKYNDGRRTLKIRSSLSKPLNGVSTLFITFFEIHHILQSSFCHHASLLLLRGNACRFDRRKLFNQPNACFFSALNGAGRSQEVLLGLHINQLCADLKRIAAES